MTDGFHWWSGAIMAFMAATLYLLAWLLSLRKEKKRKKENGDMREHLRKKKE